MNAARLHLRYEVSPQAETAAVFLAGDSVEDWLKVLVGSGWSLSELSLFMVPLSPKMRKPRGLFVVLSPTDSGRPPCFGQHYRRWGQKLYIPNESAIFPPVDEKEFDALMSKDSVAAVWHPQSGLVVFEASDQLRVVDLVRLPEVQDAAWNEGRTGVVSAPRLLSVAAKWPETPDQMLAQGSDGIGAKSEDLLKPNRPLTDSLTAAARAGMTLALSPLAWMAKNFSSLVPATAQHPTWVNQMTNWANQILQNGNDLFDARARVLRRLIKMLDETPDVGLEYAMPLGGEPGCGPRAMPGAELFRRLVKFDLNRMFSHVAGDPWDVPASIRFSLLERYRRLAEREVGLGRYQRAAYIYAELLRDLNSAAATLVNGRYFREAAVLYRDKLHRPLDAAHCLERGGLLQEAIPLYEQLKQFETVGDLYGQLDQPEQARAAYQAHVAACVNNREILTAAKCLEQKLASPDAALDVLESHWQSAAQSRQCLATWFELNGKLGRHATADGHLRRLRTASVFGGRRLSLVDAICDVAATYPDAAIRHTAADAARIFIANALGNDNKLRHPLLRALERLTPEDRLLPRDTRRYLQTQQQSRRTPIAGRKRGQRRWRAELKSHWMLVPDQGHPEQGISAQPAIWQRCLSTQRGLFCLGERRDFNFLSVIPWNDIRANHVVTWPKASFPSSLPLMSVDTVNHAVHLVPMQGVKKTFHLENESQQWLAGMPGCLSDDTVSIAHCGGVTWTITYPALALMAFNHNQLPVKNIQLLPPPDWKYQTGQTIPLYARDEAVYAGLGTYLLQSAGQNSRRTIELDSDIRQIAGSMLHSLTRLAVLFEHGGVVIWPGLSEEIIRPLPDDLVQPQAVFLRDGRLLITSGKIWQLYATSRKQLEFLGEIEGLEIEPSELLPTYRQNEFVAVHSRRDEISVYQILPHN